MNELNPTAKSVANALGKAENRYNEVFNHPEARGRFKEGMSIAQSIYQKAVMDAVVAAVPAQPTQLYSVTVDWEQENGGQYTRTYVVMAGDEVDASAAAREAATGFGDTDITVEVRPFLGELKTRVLADLQLKNDQPVWRTL